MKNFLAIVLFLSVLSACTINSEPNVPNKIMVTGSAEMNIVPNEIYVVFTVSEYLDKQKKKVKLKEVKDEFLQVCLAAGIIEKDIEVSEYSGYKEWDYNNWRRKKDAEVLASISYVVKMNKLKKMDKIVDKLNGKSIQNFYIQRTTHSDLLKFRRQVKEKAVRASKTKARYLAESIGQTIGGAILIQEVNNNDYSSDYNYRSNYSMQGTTSNSLTYSWQANAGYTTYSAPSLQKIKLRYEIKAEFSINE